MLLKRILRGAGFRCEARDIAADRQREGDSGRTVRYQVQRPHPTCISQMPFSIGSSAPAQGVMLVVVQRLPGIQNVGGDTRLGNSPRNAVSAQCNAHANTYSYISVYIVPII